MRKLFIFISIILFAIHISSCDDNSEILTNPLNEIPSDSVIVSFLPVDSKINVTLTEEINPSNRTLKLFFYTDDYYSLSGSKIISELEVIKNRIEIVIKEIKASTGGAAIQVPATAKFDLDILKEGFYYLDIMINNKNIIGFINVFTESYEMDIQPNNIIRFTNNILHRIPQSIIWGESESINKTYYKIFLDSLEILGAESHYLQIGNYSYFAVDSSGGIKINSAFGMANGQHFLYNFEGDTLVTRNLIKRLSKRYSDNIHIRLLGGRGERFYSNILVNEPW